MLKKENRLTLNTEFDTVFQKGWKSYSKILGVRSYLNRNHSCLRFGILVNVKISKKAVVRNKIKRRIRAIIYSQLPFLKTGFDIMVITLPAIVDKSYQEIHDDLVGLFHRLRLYKK